MASEFPPDCRPESRLPLPGRPPPPGEVGRHCFPFSACSSRNHLSPFRRRLNGTRQRTQERVCETRTEPRRRLTDEEGGHPGSLISPISSRDVIREGNSKRSAGRGVLSQGEEPSKDEVRVISSLHSPGKNPVVPRLTFDASEFQPRVSLRRRQARARRETMQPNKQK